MKNSNLVFKIHLEDFKNNFKSSAKSVLIYFWECLSKLLPTLYLQ